MQHDHVFFGHCAQLLPSLAHSVVLGAQVVRQRVGINRRQASEGGVDLGAVMVPSISLASSQGDGCSECASTRTCAAPPSAGGTSEVNLRCLLSARCCKMAQISPAC